MCTVSTVIIHIHLVNIAEDGSPASVLNKWAEAFYKTYQGGDSAEPQLIYHEVDFNFPEINEATGVAVTKTAQKAAIREHQKKINNVVAEVRKWDSGNNERTIRRIVLVVSTHSDDDTGLLFEATNLANDVDGVSICEPSLDKCLY